MDGLRRSSSPRRLRSALQGHELKTTRRHGKSLFVLITGAGWLHLHSGMSGHLEYGASVPRDRSSERLGLDFTNGSRLACICTRKPGRIRVGTSGWTTSPSRAAASSHTPDDCGT